MLQIVNISKPHTRIHTHLIWATWGLLFSRIPSFFCCFFSVADVGRKKEKHHARNFIVFYIFPHIIRGTQRKMERERENNLAYESWQVVKLSTVMAKAKRILAQVIFPCDLWARNSFEAKRKMFCAIFVVGLRKKFFNFFLSFNGVLKKIHETFSVRIKF